MGVVGLMSSMRSGFSLLSVGDRKFVYGAT